MAFPKAFGKYSFETMEAPYLSNRKVICRRIDSSNLTSGPLGVSAFFIRLFGEEPVNNRRRNAMIEFDIAHRNRVRRAGLFPGQKPSPGRVEPEPMANQV